MKKISALLMTLLICLLSSNLYAAQKDAADCKDHPLLPRLPGYFIAGCAESDANFDFETVPGKTPETIHVEGSSLAVSFSTQPELKSKPGRAQILSSFEKAVKKNGGGRVGMVNSAPVYKLVDGGKESLVVLLADVAGGGYAYRIIDKQDMVPAQKAEVQDDSLGCRQYGPPLFTPLPRYAVCGCGGQESSDRSINIVKGKATETIRVQGRLTQMTYCPQDERPSLNEQQIRRNFENDIKKLGGTFIGKSVKKPGVDVYKLTKDGKETWIEVWTEKSGNYNYVVTR